MTNKERVQQFYPNAKAESHRARNPYGGSYTYWLIRIGNSYMPFEEGKTQAQAWKAAFEKIWGQIINERNAKKNKAAEE